MYKEFSCFVFPNSVRTTHILRNSPYIDRFKILSIELPMSFYTTNSNNNIIVFQEGATVKSCTLPPGNYTIDTITNAIANAMNSVSSGYSCNFNLLTRNLTITNATAFSIRSFTNGSTAWRTIGAHRLSDSASSTTWTGNVVDLTSNAPFLLVSSELSSHDLTFIGFEHINVLAMVSTNAPNGSVMSWTNPGGYVYCGQNLSYVSFMLLDSSTLLPVDLNNQPMAITIGTLSDPDDIAM
jgi:hypothetical protein